MAEAADEYRVTLGSFRLSTLLKRINFLLFSFTINGQGTYT